MRDEVLLVAWEKENNATQLYGLCAYTWFGSVGDIILQPVKAQHTAKSSDVTDILFISNQFVWSLSL